MGRQMPFVAHGVKEKMTGKLHNFPDFSQFFPEQGCQAGKKPGQNARD